MPQYVNHNKTMSFVILLLFIVVCIVDEYHDRLIMMVTQTTQHTNTYYSLYAHFCVCINNYASNIRKPVKANKLGINQLISFDD